MNQNIPTDSANRPQFTLGASEIVLEVKAAAGQTVTTDIKVDGDIVSDANPLPVAGELTITDSALPTGAATETTQLAVKQGVKAASPFNEAEPYLMTGLWVVKNSAAVLDRLVAQYLGASATVYLQIHRWNDSGIGTNTILEPGIEMGTGTKSVAIFAPVHKLICSDGLVLAFSETQSTYTAAGTETAFVTVYGE